MFCWLWTLYWTMTIITAVIAFDIGIVMDKRDICLEGKCSCIWATLKLVKQMHCPPNGTVTEDNQTVITIVYGHGFFKGYVELMCPNYLPILNTTTLPTRIANLTDQIKHITVIKCHLPNNFQSILLNNFGLTNLKDIVFTWTKLENVSLNKESSVKLDGLTNLVLRENHLAQLDDEVFKNLGDLMYLDLSTNGLKNIPDNLFDSLNKLVKLDLSNNEIKTIESPFRNQRGLTHLFLQNNKIHLIKEDSLKSLTELQVLRLEHNNLQNLPSGLFSHNPSLQVLRLEHNNLKNLPPGLFSHNPSLQVLRLEHNNLKNLPSGLFSHNPSLQVLRLEHNNLKNLPPGLFSHNPSLQVLRLQHNNLKNLSTSLFNHNPSLQNISLNNNYGLLLSDYQFASWTGLYEIELSQLNLSQIPENIFHNCDNLFTVNLAGNKLKDIPEALFRGKRKLRILKLNDNSLKALPDNLFIDLFYISELHLQDNLIESISKELFRTTRKINYINLEHNKIKHIDFDAFWRNNPTLNTYMKTIKLSYNILTEFSLELFRYLPFIKHVDISHNKINKLVSGSDPEAWIYMPEVLDLSHNNLSQAEITNLLSTLSSDIVYVMAKYPNLQFLDIQFNNISAIVIEVNRSGKGDKKIIDIGNNKATECVCKILDLFNISNPHSDSIRCSQPNPIFRHFPIINKLQIDDLSCPLEDLYANDYFCPEECSCFVKTYTKTITVDCSKKNLTTLPNISIPGSLAYNDFELILDENNFQNVPDISLINPQLDNVSILVLTNNKIENVLWLPSKLKVLDLSGNRLEKLDNKTLKNFERLKEVNLGKNPWTCDCQIGDLVAFLRNHTEKFVLKHDIKCKDTNQPVIDLDLTFLCHYVLIYSTIGFLIVMIIFATATTLYYRYREQMEIFLYSHKVCMCFIRSEEEIDRNKEYDALICFSQKEDAFVETLQSVLENETHGYKLCIHHRDWKPGIFILDQIERSVLSSRRTVVILSNNFLESVWAQTEFKMALTKAMKEGRTRVIVILYEDISANIDKLDDVLKNYIKCCTYIQWGDKWFWDKLLYAMPHHHDHRRCN